MNGVVTTTQDQQLLTTAEVAALMRAPESSVRYWRYLGRGPASFRIGRRVLYRRDVVLAWLADREAGAPEGSARSQRAPARRAEGRRRVEFGRGLSTRPGP